MHIRIPWSNDACLFNKEVLLKFGLYTVLYFWQRSSEILALNLDQEYFLTFFFNLIFLIKYQAYFLTLAWALTALTQYTKPKLHLPYQFFNLLQNLNTLLLPIWKKKKKIVRWTAAHLLNKLLTHDSNYQENHKIKLIRQEDIGESII